MSIKHAPWPTSIPPVGTAYWDQAAWDSFAEAYRPKGYDGDIRDHKAYLLWSAAKAIKEAKLHAAGKLDYIPVYTLVDINRHCRVARMCLCSACFCCAILTATYQK